MERVITTRTTNRKTDDKNLQGGRNLGNLSTTAGGVEMWELPSGIVCLIKTVCEDAEPSSNTGNTVIQ